eukprot:TRINITY_DN1866_c0_g1_i1.p1 TRINITY_DN1866_c0_g1~~TRINITY_DN1866_c0_g1_i1.p1  ORF type:complete len:422 (+),score=108.76 TRINITY_DN1866_c0_g1_i1:68-1333(+)
MFEASQYMAGGGGGSSPAGGAGGFAAAAGAGSCGGGCSRAPEYDFATDFLDGFDVLSKQSEATVKATKQLGSFFGKMSDITKDYVKRINSLCANYRKKQMRRFNGSVQAAVQCVVDELEKVSSSQLQFITDLHDLKKDAWVFAKEQDKQCKLLVHSYEKMSKGWKQQLDCLKRSKDNLHKLSKEAKSMDNTATKKEGKGNSDASLARAKYNTADGKAKAAERVYHDLIRQTNERLVAYYEQEQPRILKDFQSLQETHVGYHKQILEQYANQLGSVHVNYTWGTASEAVSSIVGRIEVGQDIAEFVQKSRTGVTEPPPFQVELVYSDSGDGGSSSSPFGSKPSPSPPSNPFGSAPSSPPSNPFDSAPSSPPPKPPKPARLSCAVPNPFGSPPATSPEWRSNNSSGRPSHRPPPPPSPTNPFE